MRSEVRACARGIYQPPIRFALEKRPVRSAVALEVPTCPDTERAARTPLLFVHGAHVGAWRREDHFLPWFAAQGFPAYALSLRGHGGSGGRETLHASGLADHAEDLAAAVTLLRRPPVFVALEISGWLGDRGL